jgi:hypothetical protein
MAIDDPQGIRWDCPPCLPLSPTASPHQKSGRARRCLNGCRAHLPGSTNLMPPCLLVGGTPRLLGISISVVIKDNDTLY